MRSWKDIRLGRRAIIRPAAWPSLSGQKGTVLGLTNRGVDVKLGYAVIVKLDDGMLIGLEPKEVYLSKA